METGDAVKICDEEFLVGSTHLSTIYNKYHNITTNGLKKHRPIRRQILSNRTTSSE